VNEGANPAECFVPLGFVSGVHGLKGWVKVHSWTQPREAIFGYQPWLIGDERREVRVRDSRLQGKTLLAALPGVEDREAAAALVGASIAIQRDQLPELPEGEHYWSDLIGLSVETLSGCDLGRVERLQETGANDVLVVQGDRERLIPYVPGRYVVRVDLDGRRIVVDWDSDF
jgi:16S rRNA processing protein RimM